MKFDEDQAAKRRKSKRAKKIDFLKDFKRINKKPVAVKKQRGK